MVSNLCLYPKEIIDANKGRYTRVLGTIVHRGQKRGKNPNVHE